MWFYKDLHVSSSVQVIVCSNPSPKPSPIYVDAFEEVTDCDSSYQEVGRCCTRDGSRRMFITFASLKVNKAGPTLALKLRGDVTRNPKQGYQRPQKGQVSSKNFQKDLCTVAALAVTSVPLSHSCCYCCYCCCCWCLEQQWYHHLTNHQQNLSPQSPSV